jgi:hypothetical protein
VIEIGTVRDIAGSTSKHFQCHLPFLSSIFQFHKIRKEHKSTHGVLSYFSLLKKKERKKYKINDEKEESQCEIFNLRFRNDQSGN